MHISGISLPITTAEPLKSRFCDNSDLLSVVNNINIYHMLFTISYSKSVYPIIPAELLKATLYDDFGISVYFVYFIFI